ncbi:hypothetical protein [Pseudarthrobacter sp. DSP2-3-2b1]|uniref:hypothetical protein n=1 Tax=Pseudarthrobacter sp. DSP2-3-2b1 TaxID=2804661 RepID=UPI003CEE7566
MGQPAPGRQLTLLAEGRVELLGRIPRSSNETFLAEVTAAVGKSLAVYKPEAGERPLSDFEPGLFRRERAAYLLSEHLGWGIDHGLCFSAPFKLRTVIWDFAGEPIPAALLEDITPLTADVPAEMAELLDDAEVAALKRRVQRVLHDGVLPMDHTGRRYPWPLV